MKNEVKGKEGQDPLFPPPQIHQWEDTNTFDFSENSQ